MADLCGVCRVAVERSAADERDERTQRETRATSAGNRDKTVFVSFTHDLKKKA